MAFDAGDSDEKWRPHMERTASALDWATFWVTLVGTALTLAALVTAIAIGLHEARAIRREAEDREEARLAEAAIRRSEQARQVSARLEIKRNRPDGPEFTFIDVLNASSGPIYNVKVVLPWKQGAYVIPTNEKVLLGGERGHVHVPLNAARVAGAGTPIEVQFRDAAGDWWHRGEDGHVCLLPEEPYADATPTEAPGRDEHGIS